MNSFKRYRPGDVVHVKCYNMSMNALSAIWFDDDMLDFDGTCLVLSCDCKDDDRENWEWYTVLNDVGVCELMVYLKELTPRVVVRVC